MIPNAVSLQSEKVPPTALLPRPNKTPSGSAISIVITFPVS